jgi:hypothetical protein
MHPKLCSGWVDEGRIRALCDKLLTTPAPPNTLTSSTSSSNSSSNSSSTSRQPLPWLGLSGRELLQHTVIPALSHNGAVQRTVQEYRDCLQDMLLLTDRQQLNSDEVDSSSKSSGSAKQQQQQQLQNGSSVQSADSSVLATATIASGLVELARGSSFDSPSR